MFRILSLDGGGIKGAFTASVLGQLEEDTRQNIVDHFDMITGTSTGGIIAIGLGLGIPAKEILKFYQTHGPRIFPETSLVERAKRRFRQFFRPKYSHQVLREELTKILGGRKFGESRCRLVIPTFDAIGGRIFLMKTAHHERFKYDHNTPAVDVALATAAAPTYFAATDFPHHQGGSYVDGGVWANSPVLVGIVEAVGFLEKKIEEIDLLSIGSISHPISISQNKNSGIAQWNTGLIELLFEAQVQAAIAQARLLLGGRLHRIHFTACPGQFKLDDARPEKIQALTALGRSEAVKKENLEIIRERFLNGQPAKSFKQLYAQYPLGQ